MITRTFHKIIDDFHNMKKEYYFISRESDNEIKINKISTDKRLDELESNIIDLKNKFNNFNNFYNKRMNIVYKNIYDIKSTCKDIQG